MHSHQIAMSRKGSRFFVLLCLLHCSDRVECFSHTPPVVGQPKTPLADSSSSLRTLYPPISPYCNGTLEVDSIHTIFYQEYGNANGIPALFLHGGPGAGCFPRHAQFFDPALYRIVLLDQRGSGASTPRGEVQNNTLMHLVQDCETLRLKLGVDQWGVLLGGSWGSTLALAYAQEHADKIQSLLLRGVCLLRSIEVDWLFGGTSEFALQPAWRDFERAVGVVMEDDDGGEDGLLAKEGIATRRRQALHAHYDRLLSGDATLRLAAARSWMQWEVQVSSSFKAPTNKTKDSKKVTSTQQESERKEDPTIVLVGRPEGDGKRAWGFRGPRGELVPGFVSESPSKFKDGLRKQMLHTPPLPPVVKQYEMRPIQHIANDTKLSSNSALINATSGNMTSGNITSGNTTSALPNQWANFIPSQAMLTCFYSVNDRYAMNNLNLLDRMDRIADIPCIAVQGGNDQICPVNTALDVAKAYPKMELRIPIKAGHSMYDPAITNELVRATDRLATASTLAE